MHRGELSGPTRIIDAGTVDPVTSQALYHAVARSIATGEVDNTVLLVRPGGPYASLGYHYSSAVVDLEYCREMGFPVFRRRIGGGLVYLDRQQLFVQFCVEELPRYRDQAYTQLMAPLVASLDTLGVTGGLSDGFDLTANGRKIGGIGAGDIDGAAAVTTGILADFDWERATNIHATPTAAFRRHLKSTMRSRVTTLNRELPTAPDIAQIKDTVRGQLSAAFPAPYEGTLTSHEHQLLDAERDRLTSDEFLHMIDQQPTHRRVKVTDGVFLRLVHTGDTASGSRVLLEERDATVTDVRSLDDSLPVAATDLTGKPVDDAIDQLTEIQSGD